MFYFLFYPENASLKMYEKVTSAPGLKHEGDQWTSEIIPHHRRWKRFCSKELSQDLHTSFRGRLTDVQVNLMLMLKSGDLCDPEHISKLYVLHAFGLHGRSYSGGFLRRC